MLDEIRNKFEHALEERLMNLVGTENQGLNEMIRYHFGWHDPEVQRGKRLRPIIHLLATTALGKTFEDGVYSAVALEIFHNFTLVHDDIQDKGQFRQGRPALWTTEYGFEQAINTGDFLAYAAFAILNQDNNTFENHQQTQLNRAFTVAGLDVMRGQYLDMLYEQEDIISLEQYLEMIRHKTSRLFSLAFEMAGLISTVPVETLSLLRAVGTNIGIAFQIQDDYLGIWGNSNITGKSTSTDIMTKKKTYPIISGLNTLPEMKELWKNKTPLSDETIIAITRHLTDSGIHERTLSAARKYKEKALSDFYNVFKVDTPWRDTLYEVLETMIR